MIKVLSAFFMLALVTFAMPLDTEETPEKNALAVIVQIDGKAKLLPNESIKKHKAKLGESLQAGDKLITYKDAKVILRLLDNSNIILNESSEITVISETSLEQESGEIYYKIKKRTKSKGLKVKTPFSIIGIKGTEFIVNTANDGQIALNEGLVGIESLRADFELHKKQIMDEFNEYKRKQDKEFAKYKNPTGEEVVSYVKEFDLEASHVLNFGDKSNCDIECESYVTDDMFDEEIEEMFSDYQQMLAK